MRIVILGAAESGVGAAVLALKKGFQVFVSDMGNIKANYKEILDKYGIRWEENKHTEDEILCADEIIKSPGIPDTAPMVVKAIDAGIPVISEIEFAGRYTNAKMICITGSNGKTTTTSLIYHILKNAGYNVGLAGNIGRSLALQIAEGCDYTHYVIELSSFQLDNMYEFRANIAVLLNITPDHLDRYDNKMQNYTDSKMRIIQNQTEEDVFIYWADDPIVKEEIKKGNVTETLTPGDRVTHPKFGFGQHLHEFDVHAVWESRVTFDLFAEYFHRSGFRALHEHDSVRISNRNGRANDLAFPQGQTNVLCGLHHAHIHRDLFRFTAQHAQIERFDARKRFDGQAGLIGVAFVVHVFSNAADAVAAHFCLAPVGVENAHLEIGDL